MRTLNCFNIRVYGICLEANHVLVSDEYVMDLFMTKFPGGGLEYGEGPPECLKRECKEEMGFDVEVLQHFYTTDFFQATRFFDNTQLISIYYFFKLPENHQLPFSKKQYDFEKIENGVQSFRWISLEDLKPTDLTFPIDQKVAEMLKDQKIKEG